MTTEELQSPPRLMKERQRHSRYFALALIPLIILQVGKLEPGFWRDLMVWTGYLLVPIAVLGRAYSTAFIGGRKNEQIIDQGPYSVVRNPLYVFSFIGVIGIALESASPLFLILLAGGFCWYYPQVIRHEEEFLLARFGEPYRDYMRRVPRWWPSFSLWKEPAMIEVSPHFIRRTMLDASVFFLPLPVFALIEGLHRAGIISGL